MNVAQHSAAEVLASLHSGEAGLTAQDAARRLAHHGPNAIEELRAEPLALRLAREFTHFFALILWVAAALAFVAESYDPGEGMAALGGAIVAVIVINGVFSFLQEYRAERAVAALRRLLPALARVQRDGRETQVPAAELVPGDVVLLEEGDEVPADGRVLEASSVHVNAATITGESLPVEKHAGASDEPDLARAPNVVLAGTSVVTGRARIVVFATGMATEFGRIAHLTQRAPERPSPLQHEIRRLSRLVALLALVLGAVFFAIGQAVGIPFWANFIFAIGIIIANVPEGLLPTVTLSLAMATQRMARRNALVRHLPAVETLGAATVICTDKTGTLTLNRMEVRRLHVAGREHDRSEAAVLARPHRALFEVALHCHTVRDVVVDGAPRALGDPMEIALRALGREVLGAGAERPRLDEIRFDAARMRLSTVHAGAGGAALYCKGALQTVLPLCDRTWTERGAVALDERARGDVRRAEDRLAERGMRVLALAWRELPPGVAPEERERGLVFAGLVALEDPPRAEVPDAVRTCRAAGVRTIMVTGDHPRTALAIAREIGLVVTPEPRVVTGDRLARLSEAQLLLELDAPEILFARVGPDQKLAIVRALQRRGEIVAVTGDGVNDAPALKHADIGIAMAIGGTDVAQEAADMVLLDDNFASIVAAIEEGRAVFENLRKFLTYILTSNVPELVPYLAFVLFRIPLPLTILQILAVDLGTDLLPALALGAEPPNGDVMRRPPRSHRERLLSPGLLARAYLWLGPMEAVAGMCAFFYVLSAGGWTHGTPLARDAPLYLRATTACLAAIVAGQVVNVFLCRDPRRPAFAFGRGGNPLLGVAVAAEIALLLAIVYTPAGHAVFGTAPLGADAWRFIAPFAAGMLIAEEARKAIAVRLARGGAATARA